MAPTPKPRHPSVAPPSTAHTLKPHHIQLLGTLWVLFDKGKSYDSELPSPFVVHVYRVLILEISECRQPASFAQLIAKLREGSPFADDLAPQQALSDMERWPQTMHDPDALVKFFQGIQKTMAERIEDETCRFARRSLFGYFVRRCCVSSIKLSFEAISTLWHEFHMWVVGRLDDSSYHVRKDLITNSYNIYKTNADKKEYAHADDYATWELGLAVGDEILASESLRKFFEQRFHNQNDSGLRQHALLNLARMHWIRHEYVACRKLLQEAITTARTCNDRQTLQHCTGLMNRLPTAERSRRPLINDIQPDLHPLEVLHDAKKFLTVAYQQPISAAFDKITQAAGLYDVWSETQSNAVTDADRWGQHAVQGVAWSIMGNTQLANIEDTTVTAFTDPGSADNSRLTATLNRAYRQARQGGYQDAIAALLEPDVWSGLTVGDCQTWANEIWHIIALRTSRRGQERMFHDFLLPKRPPGMYHPGEYWYGTTSPPLGSLIRDPLIEVLAAREVKQAHSAVEPLLTALWHAEFQQRFGQYRTALAMLADVGLEYGMTKWCRRTIEEILPQVINGDDREQRGFVCFTFARCIIASEDSIPEALRECIPYLDIAENDYAALGMYHSLQDVQFLLSVVYHNLDMTEKRDKVAERHREVGKQKEEAEKQVFEPWIAEVLDIVADISTTLASRSLL